MDRRSQAGWVYVLSHPVWSRINGTGAIKIGKTTRDPGKRSLEIAASSGLLRAPTIEWCAWVADCGAVERAVHRHLARYRVTQRREFFAVSVATARATIESATMTRTIIGLHSPEARYPHRTARPRMRVVGVVMALATLLAYALLH